MANLKTLVEAKLDQIESDETNLDKGRVWAYSPGTEYTNFVNGFCWIACSTGNIPINKSIYVIFRGCISLQNWLADLTTSYTY